MQIENPDTLAGGNTNSFQALAALRNMQLKAPSTLRFERILLIAFLSIVAQVWTQSAQAGGAIFTGSTDTIPATGSATHTVDLSPGGFHLGGGTTDPATLPGVEDLAPPSIVAEIAANDFQVSMDLDPACPGLPHYEGGAPSAFGILVAFADGTRLAFGWINTLDSSELQPFGYHAGDDVPGPGAAVTGFADRITLSRSADAITISSSWRGTVAAYNLAPGTELQTLGFLVFPGSGSIDASGEIDKVIISSPAITTDINGFTIPTPTPVPTPVATPTPTPTPSPTPTSTPTPTPTPGPLAGAIFTGSNDAIPALSGTTHPITLSPGGIRLGGGTVDYQNLPGVEDLAPSSISTEILNMDFEVSIDLDPACPGLPGQPDVLPSAFGITAIFSDGQRILFGWINPAGTPALSPFAYRAGDGYPPWGADVSGFADRVTLTRTGTSISIASSWRGALASYSVNPETVLQNLGFLSFVGAGPLDASGMIKRVIFASNYVQTSYNGFTEPTPTPAPTPLPTPIPTPVPDTFAPVIINGPFVSGLSNQSATIVWSTDEPANSRVDYGTSSGTLGQQVNNGTFATQHEVTLTGLSAATTYYFRGSSTDQDTNGPTFSIEQAFITAATADTNAPELLAPPVAAPVTTTTAQINWETSEPSITLLRHGPTTALGSSASIPGLRTAHSITLSALVSATSYYYSLRLIDASGNQFDTPISSFQTASIPDTTPPNIVQGPGYGAVTDTTAYIGWTTDEPSDSRITYDDGITFREVSSGAKAIGHLFQLTGLTPATIYHVTVQSTDASGNGPAISSVFSVPTRSGPDTNPPHFLEGPQVLSTTDKSAQLRWVTNEESSTTIFYNRADDPSSLLDVFNAVHDPAPTVEHLKSIGGLTTDTAYKFVAISTDSSGNTGLSGQRQFRTLDTPDTAAPIFLVDPQIVGTTDVAASFFWVTDEPSTTRVEYGVDPPGTLDQIREDPRMVTVHRVTLVGLTPGAFYGFRISSIDPAGNIAVFGAGARASLTGALIFSGFNTATDPDTAAPQLIEGPEIISLSANQATIRWVTDEIADSRVSFRVQGSFLSLPEIQDLDRDFEHFIVLSGLDPSTTYNFSVSSVDVSGNRLTSNLGNFATPLGPDSTAPSISTGPSIIDIDRDRATVLWTTDEFATSTVDFGTSPTSLRRQTSRTGHRGNHAVTLTNLISGQLYYIRVRSSDYSGNEITSSIIAFQTQAILRSDGWELYP